MKKKITQFFLKRLVGSTMTGIIEQVSDHLVTVKDKLDFSESYRNLVNELIKTHGGSKEDAPQYTIVAHGDTPLQSTVWHNGIPIGEIKLKQTGPWIAHYEANYFDRSKVSDCPSVASEPKGE